MAARIDTKSNDKTFAYIYIGTLVVFISSMFLMYSIDKISFVVVFSLTVALLFVFVIYKPSAINNRFVALATLFTIADVTKECPGNCGCNAACGCQDNRNCCENKCACDSKGKDFYDLEDMFTMPLFREIIVLFDANKLKTIGEFKDLVNHVSAKVKSSSSG